MNFIAQKPFTAAITPEPPLVVDLDGTLIDSDLLIESGFALLSHSPKDLGAVLVSAASGKAAIKAAIARVTTIDVSTLPYNPDVMALIAEARADGRQVYLASASNERYVADVANHLGVFDGWFASDSRANLSSTEKARVLVARFGAGGFDYAGNASADLAVWSVARKAIAVRAPSSVRGKLAATKPDAQIIPGPSGDFRAWIKLLRVHQWAKNALLFVPLLTAQKFGLMSFATVALAALLFSIAASSIYIINDLADLAADRGHPVKKNRPLASGRIPLIHGLVAAPLLLAGALVGAAFIAPAFLGVLALYLVLTTAYTFFLKRKMIIDVITLAGLYSLRVVAGSAALSVMLSEWLLAFSMFIFTALALIKRYVELATLLDREMADPSNRNYRKSDLDIVAALAAAAGFNAVTVFALYVASPTVHQLYHRPYLLWLICPILMYWLGRALMMAHRRHMDDDPILFAIKDPNSLGCSVLMGVIVLAAI